MIYAIIIGMRVPACAGAALRGSGAPQVAFRLYRRHRMPLQLRRACHMPRADSVMRRVMRVICCC